MADTSTLLKEILSTQRLNLEERLTDRRGQALFRVGRSDGRRYALKIRQLPADALQLDSFQRELRSRLYLSQQGLSPEVLADEKVGWILIPWLAGPSASDLCRELRKEPSEKSAKEQLVLFIKMAKVLLVLHEAGIVHGDLQGEHFILEGEEFALLDFGRSRFLEDRSPLPEGGMVHFNSPEVCERIRTGSSVPVHDHISEVFSFGALIFFLFSGALPFEYNARERSYEELLDIIHYAKPRALSSVIANAPSGLILAVAGCLKRDRGERYQSMAEVLAMLAKI